MLWVVDTNVNKWVKNKKLKSIMVIVLLLVTINPFLCFQSIEVISRIHCKGGSTLTVNPSQSMLTSKKMFSSEGWKKVTKTIWNPVPNQSHSSTTCQWQAYAIMMVESRMPHICIFTKWNQWFQHTVPLWRTSAHDTKC